MLWEKEDSNLSRSREFPSNHGDPEHHTDCSPEQTLVRVVRIKLTIPIVG